MRSQRELPSLALTHKASTSLYTALAQNKPTAKPLLRTEDKQIKATANVTGFVERRDVKEGLLGEVRALSNFTVPEKNVKIENMISKQKENRRTRHLSVVKEFDSWVETLYENIERTGEECVRKWEFFASESENELVCMIEEFSDSSMLETEYELIAAAFDNIKLHLTKREEEANDMRMKLLKLETERKQSVEDLLETLNKQLVDIAFFLEPEVKLLVEDKRKSVLLDVEEREDRILGLNNGVRLAEEEMRQELRERVLEKENRWRTLHHEDVLKQYFGRVTSKSLVNPKKRVKLYMKLRDIQLSVFSQRVTALDHFGETSLAQLSEQYCLTFIDTLNTINDDAQKVYDENIQSLVEFQKDLDLETNDLLEITQNQLEFYKAQHAYSSIEELVEQECLPPANALKEQGRTLLMKVIKYLEETDIRTNGVALNLAKFWVELGKTADEHAKKQEEEATNYVLAIATREDENDENIEIIQEDIGKAHKLLTQAVTYEELDTTLADCLSLIANLSTEYREFSTDISDIIRTHPAVISNVFEIFLDRFGSKFGLSILSKQEEYIEKIKEQKLQEFESEKQKQLKEEPKKKLVKKEDEFVFEIPTFEETEIYHIHWFVLKSFDQIVKELLYTEEDNETGIRMQTREEEKRKREEERVTLEEGRKKDEAKKNKGGKKAPSPAEGAKIEEEAPVEPEEVVEDPFPVDPDDNPCLHSDVFITAELASNWLRQFQESTLSAIIVLREAQLENATSEDEAKQKSVFDEIEAAISNLEPQKQGLQGETYDNRALEIKRHLRRYERHETDFMEKHGKQTELFGELVLKCDGIIDQYVLDTLSQQKSFVSATSLAELHGILRKGKEQELFMLQSTQQVIEDLHELAFTETMNLAKQNSLFTSRLTLTEDCGTHSPQEVEFYKAKINNLSQLIEEAKTERTEHISQLTGKISTQGRTPMVNLEKEYTTSLENFAAREGIGKKYGAPQRTAQEKLRAEMTKCERAQEGIKQAISQLEALIGEYRQVLSAGAHSHFTSRFPSIAIEIRKSLVSIRSCTHKLGTHLAAFKEEPAQLRPLTWTETAPDLSPSAEEQKSEAERTEWALEPLYELGLHKQVVPWGQRVLEIEKQVKEECLKLYQAKSGTLPEFMEKYVKGFRESSEKFRLKQIKELRESAMRLFVLAEMLPETVFNSTVLGTLHLLRASITCVDSELQTNTAQNEATKQRNSQALRPNLANPAIRDELESLATQEAVRAAQYTEALRNTEENFLQLLRGSADEFKKRILNNTDAQVLLYDASFVFGDFVQLPGDEQVESKRSNIKRLTRKKKSGKSGESAGTRGYKKAWTGLTLSLISENDSGDSPVITSYKLRPHKALFRCRNEAFSSYSEYFQSQLSVFRGRFQELRAKEESWGELWGRKLEFLKGDSA